MSREELKPDDGEQRMEDRKQKKDNRRVRWILKWVVIIVICFCFVMVFRVVVLRKKKLPNRIMCGIKISALGKAIVVYANENDDRFPTPEKWCDLLIEHTEGTPKMFICPESETKYGESSYAMNVNLTGKKIGEVPIDVVMVFETDLGKEEGRRKETVSSREFSKFLNLPEKKGKHKVYAGRWNQAGGPNDVTLRHHKGEGCNVLYVGAYVEWIKAEDINNLSWDVEKPLPEDE